MVANLNGCHLGDQVVSGLTDELLKANPAMRRARGSSMSTIALHDAVQRSMVPGCNVLAQTIALSCIGLAILVNIGVTETHGEHTIELGDDGKEELVQRSMRPGCRVSDGLLQVSQVLMLAVLLTVAVVDICATLNGCHLGDQVVSGPIDELLKASPATRRALAEVKHVNHSLARCRAALIGTVLLLQAWGQSHSGGEGLRCPRTKPSNSAA
jgi:hypothetical protein